MKRILMGAAAVLAMTVAAFAGPMDARFGNTVTLTDTAGKVTKVMYNADGTADVVAPDGTKGAAKWVVKEDKLCVTPGAGPNAGKESCNPLTEHKVGDEWEVPAPDGSKWKAKLVAGRS